jgi:hypothetical protein
LTGYQGAVIPIPNRFWRLPMRIAILFAAVFLLGGIAEAQTLNPYNLRCMLEQSQKCFFDQDGKSNESRGGQSAHDYCAELVVDLCS